MEILKLENIIWIRFKGFLYFFAILIFKKNKKVEQVSLKMVGLFFLQSTVQYTFILLTWQALFTALLLVYKWQLRQQYNQGPRRRVTFSQKSAIFCLDNFVKKKIYWRGLKRDELLSEEKFPKRFFRTFIHWHFCIVLFFPLFFPMWGSFWALNILILLFWFEGQPKIVSWWYTLYY